MGNLPDTWDSRLGTAEVACPGIRLHNDEGICRKVRAKRTPTSEDARNDSGRDWLYDLLAEPFSIAGYTRC